MAEVAVILAAALLVCLVAGSLLSCSRNVYIPVESVRETSVTDTLIRYRTVTVSDSVLKYVYEQDLRYDSVAPVLDSLNRVIGWERWHFRNRTRTSEAERQRLMAINDSLRRVKADTVRITKTRTVEVPRKLTAWQRFRINAFWWLTGAIVAAGAAGWKLRHRRR